jgi:hypothetical protein
MRFSNDMAIAKVEFTQRVDALCANVKERRKQGIPLSPLRRKRLSAVLCETWMRHSVAVWGPDVVDLVDGDADFVCEHKPYNYAPPAYQLQRLSDVLLQD